MRRLALLLVIGLPLAGAAPNWRPLLGHVLLAAGFGRTASGFFEEAAWRGVGLHRAGDWAGAATAFAQDPRQIYNRADAVARAGDYAQAIDLYDTILENDPDDADARFNRELVARLADAGPREGPDTKGVEANSRAIADRHGHALPPAEGETGGNGDGFAGTQEGDSSRGAQGGGKVARSGRNPRDSAAPAADATGSAGNAEGAGRQGGNLADIALMLRANNRRIQRERYAQSVLPTTEWLQTLTDDPGKYLKLRILAEHESRKAKQAVYDPEGLE